MSTKWKTEELGRYRRFKSSKTSSRRPFQTSKSFVVTPRTFQLKMLCHNTKEEKFHLDSQWE